MSNPEETDRGGTRGRFVKIDLPDIVDIPSLDRALSVVIAKTAADKVDTRAALDLTRMMEIRRRALSDRDLLERLKALDAAQRAHREAMKSGK
jgi:hypothetical protein